MSYEKEVIIEVRSSSDEKTITVVMTCEQSITVEDMLEALANFVNDEVNKLDTEGTLH